MIKYPVIDIIAIQRILLEYNIKNIKFFKELNSNSNNINYCISTKTKKVVLTICEKKYLTKVKELAFLLEYLNKKKFETSKLIYTRDNKLLTSWMGFPVMLKEYIEGSVIKDLSYNLLEIIGNKIGQLHKITAPDCVPNEVKYGIEQFKFVDEVAKNSKFSSWLNEIIIAVSPCLKLNLPKSIIHGDIFPDNIIVNDLETDAVLMDFEVVAYYYRVYDLGMAIIGLCSNKQGIDLDKMCFLLKGYKNEIDLLDSELKVLKTFIIYAGASISFWRYKNFNFTRPNEKLKNHYLEMKDLVDRVKSQSEIDFYEISL